MLTFGSLFAGIGGLDLGLERAGMKCAWQVEINDYARRVLAKHWPHVRRWGDVCTFPPEPASAWGCDLVAGGFPCQDISNAGRRAGIDGKRSGLWGEFARVIRVVRPRFVLVENVSALLVRGLDRVLGDLAESGYDAEWDCLPACAFGSPHERDRVFLVAYPREVAGGCCLFPHEPDGLPRDEQWRAAQGVKSGRQWKRWLVQASSPVDGQDAHGWFRGVVNGVPGELDRIAALGNAVVPQVAEWIGRRIVAADGVASPPG